MPDQSISFAKALSAMQAEYETIKKNRTVKIKMKDRGEYSYDYAELSAIMDYMRPLMKKHGFAISSNVTTDLDLEVCLLHTDGGSRSSFFPLHKTSNPKELGSEITYMRRYGTICLLGLTTEEDDDGGAAAEGAKRRKDEGEKPKSNRKPKKTEMDTQSSTGKVQQLWIQARRTADVMSKVTGEEWDPVQWVRDNTEVESTKDLTTAQINALVDKLKKLEKDNTPPE